MAVLEPVVPDEKTAKEFLTKRSNWGRWGDQAGKGTINLITPEKRVEAAHLVKTGRSVSLSRPLPLSPTPDNPRSVIHWTYTFKHGQGGEAVIFTASITIPRRAPTSMPHRTCGTKAADGKAGTPKQ